MPEETIDTIQSSGEARIVDLICEGEVDSLIDLYLDEAPYNSGDFPTVVFDKNTMFLNGSSRTGQALLPEKYREVGVPLLLPQSNILKYGKPIVLYFNSNSYPDATSVLVNVKFGSFLAQNDSGDIGTTTVEYVITLTENGVSNSITEVIKQKSTAGFQWTTQVDLNPDSSLRINEWKIKIERTTPESLSTKISDEFALDSVIVKTNFNYNYPNSAIAAIGLDSRTFPNLAQRAYDVKMLKVRVPTGYVPTQYDDNRNVTAEAVYPTIWDGTFQSEKIWTDNPAWIFYDLVTNKRYGLGEYIPNDSLDKWTLYSISKYCDELVDKGTGETGLDGKEPRFSCNTFLTTTEEAYTVLGNLCSVFRGILYWTSGKIFATQDSIKDKTQLFTNSNVINGLFNYSSSGRSQRRTLARVRYNDPNDFYRPAVECVEDQEGIIRYGIRDFELAAFACTSRGQAYRAGMWALLSERLETESVSFDVALEGLYSRPGDIIQIYDDFRLMQRQGGRVIEMLDDKKTVILDRIMESGDGFNYSLSLNIPKSNFDPCYTGTDETQLITGDDKTDYIRTSFVESLDIIDLYNSGINTIAVVSGEFSEKYVGGTWIATATHTSLDSIGDDCYRIISIKENEDGNINIIALEYNEEKFAICESGYSIKSTPTINYSDYPISPPSSLNLSEISSVENNSLSSYIQANWIPSTGQYVSKHLASGRNILTNIWTSLNVYNNGSAANYFASESGTFEVVVRAMQVGGNLSDIISGQIVFHTGNQITSSVIPIKASLSNHISSSEYQYDTQNPLLTFSVIKSGGENVADDREALLKNAEFRIKDGGGVERLGWTSATVGDLIVLHTGVYNISGWPFRTNVIETRGVDLWGNVSSTGSYTFYNQAPPTASLNIISKTKNSFVYSLNPTSTVQSDFSGVLFYTNTVNSMPASYENKYSLNGEVVHNLDSDTVYTWWALTDTFGNIELNYNGPNIIELGQLSSGTSGLSISLSGQYDSYGNQYYTLYSTWERSQDENVRDYVIRFLDSSGSLYNYDISQCSSSDVPYFHFNSVIPGRSYQSSIATRDNYGRMSAFSDYTAQVYVPQPTIRYLQVDGRSYFVEPTYVKVNSVEITGSQNLDFGLGNILNIGITSTGECLIDAINIQSGSTYMIYAKRNVAGSTITFSDKFLWPDGEQTEISTESGAIDVLSMFAIDNQNLCCIGVNNML